MLRERGHTIALGGWANPHRDPERQADYLAAANFHAEFFLTQVVSRHEAGAVEQFLTTLRRRDVQLPGLFGVFFYRSANARTLALLEKFLPVPREALMREFEAGATPEEVCGRTIRSLLDVGARHFYISNLPIGRAPATLAAILSQARLSLS
jgi:hypothetical protein